jgi:hypothetical protein
MRVNMKRKTRPTKATLERKIKELEAQLASTYHFADAELLQASRKSYMGSAVIVEITALGGNVVMQPVAIRDGLSANTIAALRADIAKSYEDATVFKPSTK